MYFANKCMSILAAIAPTQAVVFNQLWPLASQVGRLNIHTSPHNASLITAACMHRGGATGALFDVSLAIVQVARVYPAWTDLAVTDGARAPNRDGAI